MCSLSEPLTPVTESSPSPVGYACFQMVFLNTYACVQTCVCTNVCANLCLYKCVCANVCVPTCFQTNGAVLHVQFCSCCCSVVV